MNRITYQKPIIEIPLPDLISVQKESYLWLFTEGIKELLDEINPVEDFTGRNFVLEFGRFGLEEPKVDEETAKRKNLSYKAPLKATVTLTNKVTGRKQSAEVFLGDFPVMTPRGTFIINGIERVVVTQIVRSFGTLFIAEDSPSGRKLFGAKIIPTRGAWLEFETSSRGVVSVKIDRKRRIPITTFLRAMAGLTSDEMKNLFADVDTHPDHHYLAATLERDPADTQDDAVVEVYKRIRPGDLATPESARTFVETMFYNHKRYSLGKVGRYKMNQRLGLNVPNTTPNRLLRIEDVIAVIKEIIRLNNDPDAEPDDIDHLKNRRVRAVGELVQSRLRVGLLRMERIIKDRMSVSDPQTITPGQLINNRPIIAVLQEFFASSQLSQFMDQTNPLAELEHKRRIAATGPGGLSRERAGFEVRDVHNSHYGRVCPITTPEGPNIGLVGQLATYAKINQYGFIETPYLKVNKVNGRPKVTTELVYLDAAQEEQHIIAPASTLIDSRNFIVGDRAVVRVHGEPKVEPTGKIEYIDVSPRQIVSVSTALIPFVENDDAVRASMGSNMLRQAVPLVRPDSPIIGTGMEKDAARDSGQLIFAEEAGTVHEASSSHISVTGKHKRFYRLSKFVRSNQGTCINQRPVVKAGDRVIRGQLLADSSGTDQGELALGQNVLVAFMSFGGGNFEDAIIISDRLVREDRFTSVHIEKHVNEVRETKLGPELVTRDIPNVSEEALADLDEGGIVTVGAWVEAGDILVGKISPKGETELSAEEKLLRAIFGEKAKEVMDTSLRLPHGEYGKVVDVKLFSKLEGDELAAGVLQMVEVSVAQLRKISVGDKLAGRHGNKGVISQILPVEDMPRLPDGTPVDIILNPLGVVSRMNLGQIMETHLGWAAQKLNFKIASPVFQGVKLEKIQELLEQAKLPRSGKVQLYDGRTGSAYDERTTVGQTYIMKLIHLVDDKIHARSTGPYSMVTQQPLGGKAQFGGQRFGEMEVWALEAYGAAHTLQEMLTIKSDDVYGRSKAYEAIIKGDPIQKPSTPASFMVLMRELQSLGLNVEMLRRGDSIPDPTMPTTTVKPVTKSRDIDEEITEILSAQEKPHEVPKSLPVEEKK